MNAHRTEDLLRLAHEAAHAAGIELLARAGRPARGVSAKSSHTDLVSEADRAAERAILDVVRADRPGDAILAEEGGAATGDTGLRWVIDPLDGTINYLWDIPHWAVSIAVEDAAGSLVAVVHDPSRQETFHAVRGGGAHLGARRLRLGDAPPLAEALIGTGFNYSADERARQAARLPDVLPVVRDIRRFGAAALDLAWVAAGRLDGFFERGVQRWDWAAGALLVREAGGATDELEAAPPRPAGVVAGHAALLPDLRRMADGPPA